MLQKNASFSLSKIITISDILVSIKNDVCLNSSKMFMIMTLPSGMKREMVNLRIVSIFPYTERKHMALVRPAKDNFTLIKNSAASLS